MTRFQKMIRGKDCARRFVAKGNGEFAGNILEIARAHGIPIIEDKALVEVLSSLDMYQEVPQELYEAVAEILAYQRTPCFTSIRKK